MSQLFVVGNLQQVRCTSLDEVASLNVLIRMTVSGHSFRSEFEYLGSARSRYYTILLISDMKVFENLYRFTLFFFFADC